MSNESYSTIVIMPDNSHLEVDYYCIDTNIDKAENLTQLYIQLHDCLCTLKIDKSICKNPGQLEKIVHNKVINTKGHLC